MIYENEFNEILVSFDKSFDKKQELAQSVSIMRPTITGGLDDTLTEL